MPYKDLEAQRAYQRAYQQWYKPVWRSRNREKLREAERARNADHYSAIHKWLNKYHPRSGACSQCGEKGSTGWAFQHHPSPYTRDIADYRELCVLCHKRFDNELRSRRE